MGNKETKFKEMFEEIDTSGDGQVSFNELATFIVSPKAVNQLKMLTFEEIAAVEHEFNVMDENDDDGKMTFEEFLQNMKENKTMKKLILKIAQSNLDSETTGSRPLLG